MSENIKILIVEDERIVAEDIQSSLQNIGYSISGVVSSGKEALKRIKEDKPDLVLMDIILKGRMNGIEAANTIRFQYDVPVVYLTAHADMNTLEKAKVTEPFGYILKPFNDGELQSTIEMALYKHRMESELKERNIQLSSLNVITQAVGGTLELRVILDKALREVLALSKFSGGVIFLLNENEMTPDIEVHKGVSDYTIQLLSETYADPLSDLRRILLKGDTYRFHSTELVEMKEVKKKSDRNLAEKMYCLVVPIKAGETAVGGLHLFGREEYMPEEIVFDFFSNIGSHIGMAVKNAKLYEKTNQTLEQLKITQDKLVQSEKLAGLGALASNVVHEIGNPLAAITNSVQVLQNRIALEGRMKELMDIIVWETERLARSVDELREFSRPKQLRFMQYDIREVVKKAIMVLNQDFELAWGRKIHTKMPKHFPLIWMDADAVEQMMINLLKNGLQAVEEGGVVEVRLSVQERGGPKYAVVQVKDNGPGISQDNIRRVFEPYFSTKVRGMGLGMHIVKQSIDSHHGIIQIDSGEGKGTTVTVKIPMERGENG